MLFCYLHLLYPPCWAMFYYYISRHLEKLISDYFNIYKIFFLLLLHAIFFFFLLRLCFLSYSMYSYELHIYIRPDFSSFFFFFFFKPSHRHKHTQDQKLKSHSSIPWSHKCWERKMPKKYYLTSSPFFSLFLYPFSSSSSNSWARSHTNASGLNYFFSASSQFLLFPPKEMLLHIMLWSQSRRVV